MAIDPKKNRYDALIERIFLDRYAKGMARMPFARKDLEVAASALGIELPKNLGDVIYALRYRTSLPESIAATQPPDREWVIAGTGRGAYEFRLVPINRIVPNPQLRAIKVPDATPEIIAAYALSDEQALLAKLRYNRLIDVFLGLAASSLQNHLRTTVKGIGQIEIDELYVGLDRAGRQFVIPVQAKGGKDKLSVVQTQQDILCCKEKFPTLICRAVSSQFMADDLIALFELALDEGTVEIVDEKHYRLVGSKDITPADLEAYSRLA